MGEKKDLARDTGTESKGERFWNGWERYLREFSLPLKQEDRIRR